METTVMIALVAMLLALVGVTGTIVPVLPGSIAVLAGLLVWGFGSPQPWGWVTAGVGGVLVAGGMLAQYLLTGRTMKRRAIPSRSVLVGVAAGVVGLFVIPIVGLPLGFAAGLFLAELARVKNARDALSSSAAALKALGVGMLVEFSCAILATVTLAVGIGSQLLWR